MPAGAQADPSKDCKNDQTQTNADKDKPTNC
jgi:hypothetical protein